MPSVQDDIMGTVLRSVLERATRRTMFRRRLPRANGGAPIYVSGSAGLRFLFRSMERVDPMLSTLAAELITPRSVVWDVGANIGLFTFSAAHHAGADGRVVAFEADAWLANLLQRSASIQPASSAPVEIIAAAVAERCELRTFNLSARSRATNALAGYGHTAPSDVLEQHTVRAVSLDSYADEHPAPDVIKIDVEGAEFEVLTGAARVLETRRPTLLCEVGAKNSPAVTALLKRHGYRIFNAETLGGARQELDAAPWSTLAIV